jgi:signal transduction histidine kinase
MTGVQTMRAKLSTTAYEMNSRSGTRTPPIPIRILAATFQKRQTPLQPDPQPASAAQGEAVAQGEGLLHDACNLMGALGLYCDLLSVVGVLKPEHRHYAEELRLVGTRSTALMERLMRSSIAPAWPADVRPARTAPLASLPVPAAPVTLRNVVHRCSGLLTQVAGGRTVEVSYGAAASVPLLVGEEAIERILVNLVRNAAVAMDARDLEDKAAIRIGVGHLTDRMGGLRAWPFRSVRLTVQDFGIGMTSQTLERVLSGGRAATRGGHGIGLRMVRELVTASRGELKAVSALGAGTTVQIEWPAAAFRQFSEAQNTGRSAAVRILTRVRRTPVPDPRLNVSVCSTANLRGMPS